MPQGHKSSYQIPPRLAISRNYKAMKLSHELEHEVYISHICNGPSSFFVKLKIMEEPLRRLMTELNSINLQPLEEFPLLAVCLAKRTEDGLICRAFITDFENEHRKVFYVDFGNTEFLSSDKLFQIPGKYVFLNMMSTKFALSGVEKFALSAYIKYSFEEFVYNKVLTMKVIPSATDLALPKCELRDENNIRALDVIKQQALQSYKNPLPPSRGFNQEIKVSCIYSRTRFYVQLKSKQRELSKLVDDLQNACKTLQGLSPSKVKKGIPCYALFAENGLWYRAQVININSEGIIVRYVDYGNEEIVMIECLKEPSSDEIFVLHPFAIECCLNGYQNMEADEVYDSSLEEFILDREFTMKVVEIQNKKAVIDLFTCINVDSLVLNNISTATSQVHNQRIEPRKSWDMNDKNGEDKSENFKQNKFTRNINQWEKSNSFEKGGFRRRNYSDNQDSSHRRGEREKRLDKFYKSKKEIISTIKNVAIHSNKFKIIHKSVGSKETVRISWFYNPTNFYCQLNKYKDSFKKMMEEIQQSYENLYKIKAIVGAPVIAPFPGNNCLYRAEVLDVYFHKVNVRYVDYGDEATVDFVYGIDTKYMDIPAQAINCGLQGIAPSSGVWPEPESFRKYFIKDMYLCSFIFEMDGRFYVDLSFEDISVAALLLEEHLAVSLQSNIDISLLVGQQIVIVLKNVASLSDVTIQLEPEITVSAKLHNMEMATETFEHVLSEFLLQPLIVYVDNIIEDKLEVTFYDLSGQKLEIVTPDEGAFETVDTLCAFPVYTKTLQGWVSHATSKILYIQASRFNLKLSQLLESLYEYYESMLPEEPLKPEIGFVYAVHSTDTNWYRGRVIEIIEDNVNVKYVDYGNTELIPIIQLRELIPQFFQPHMLAVEVLITDECDERKFAALSNDGSTFVQMEFVNYDTVRLYINGNDTATIGTIISSDITENVDDLILVPSSEKEECKIETYELPNTTEKSQDKIESYDTEEYTTYCKNCHETGQSTC